MKTSYKGFMKKKTISKNFVIMMFMLFALCLVVLVPSNTASAKKTETKEVIIKSVGKSQITYYMADSSQNVIPNCDWENIVGYGKKKSVKLSKNAKFYYHHEFDDNGNLKLQKVSKKKFIKELRESEKWNENGATYYSGQACELTIKNGVCIKLETCYQA